MSKKVLIITYYWPPSGGAGVQRWLKFVKYLPEFGWEPVIYTPENPEAPVEDNSLLKDIPDGIEVIKRPIKEPYSAYKKFIGQKKGEKINAGFLSEREKPKLAEKLSVWIRGNFFIPDARCFWINPSIKFLTKYLNENPVDAIISSGPPHSMHMIALGLKKRLNIPWIADFRDPWTNIDYYQDLMLSKWADRKHVKMEKEVLKTADSTVVVGNVMSEEFRELLAKRIDVITNGYDTDDTEVEKVTPDNCFSIAHIGTIPKSRNPEILWPVLKNLVDNIPGFADDLQIKLVGKLDHSLEATLKENDLTQFLQKIDYLPHDQAIRVQKESTLLLLAINNTPNAKGILTGKFFEYMASQRPILAIGPEDGDVAKILKETGAGEIANFNDKAKLKDIILAYYNKYKTNQLEINTNGIEVYSRKKLTKKLVKVLESI